MEALNKYPFAINHGRVLRLGTLPWFIKIHRLSEWSECSGTIIRGVYRTQTPVKDYLTLAEEN